MELPSVVKRMIAVILVLAAVFSVAGVVFYAVTANILGFAPFVLGVFLGAAVNIIKVIMIERTVKRVANTENAAPVGLVHVQYFIRFLITAAVLAAGVLLPFINLIGVAAGILTMPLAGYSMMFFKDRD